MPDGDADGHLAPPSGGEPGRAGPEPGPGSGGVGAVSAVVGSDEDAIAAEHGLPPVPRDLTAVECRVLGCLIEKERATPQNYPLTLNALRVACNQSTNRDPVVDYDERTVDGALGSLRERGLTRIVYSPSNRAAKFRHVFDEHLRLTPAEVSILGVLLLRGPQTIGEIKARTERLFAFASLTDAQDTLDALASRAAGPLVRRLERRPGQKDARWIHLLDSALAGAGPAGAAPPTVDQARPTANSPTTPPPPGPTRGILGGSPTAVAPIASIAPTSLEHEAPLDAEVAALRAEVARLEADLRDLRDELHRFRSAFE